MMGDDRDERDDVIQALLGQVEQLTMHLERKEARNGSISSCGYSSDEINNVNPFARQQVRENTLMEMIL